MDVNSIFAPEKAIGAGKKIFFLLKISKQAQKRIDIRVFPDFFFVSSNKRDKIN